MNTLYAFSSPFLSSFSGLPKHWHHCPLCRATLVQRNADGSLLGFKGRASSGGDEASPPPGTVCTSAKGISASENMLHQATLLSPKCTYLFGSWQLSIIKILRRYRRKINLDGGKKCSKWMFSTICQLSCWQQPSSSDSSLLQTEDGPETLLIRSIQRQISCFYSELCRLSLSLCYSEGS